jgi:hypothetical protein
MHGMRLMSIIFLRHSQKKSQEKIAPRDKRSDTSSAATAKKMTGSPQIKSKTV